MSFELVGSLAGFLCLLFLVYLLKLVSSNQTTSLTSWKVGVAVLIFSIYAILISLLHLSLIVVLISLPFVIAVIFVLLRNLLPAFASNSSGPEPKRYRLVAMPINHFGEKVRWSMDLIGVPYEEMNVGGILSLFFRGRTVPWLVDFKSKSVIGNSDEILMYLSAVYVPTLTGTQQALAQRLLTRNQTTLEWEDELNKFGHAIQGWGYYYLMKSNVSSDYSLRPWGAFEPRVSLLEKVFLRLTHSFFRTFLTVGLALKNEKVHAKRREIIDSLLNKVDSYFEKNPSALYLTGDHISYVDIIFCSLAAPLLYFTIVSPPPSANQKSFYAKNRFSSFVISNPTKYHELLSNYPKELKDLERDFLSRPCGKYVVRMYLENRWKRFEEV
jgi:glutathione S-transferase